MKKVLQTVEIEVFVEYPRFKTSEEAPHGQGWKYTFLFSNIHAVTMRRGRKKDRSEPQRRHDLLLHKSRYDPLTSIMLSGVGDGYTMNVLVYCQIC